MNVLDNGVVVDESKNAANYTPARDSRAVFGQDRVVTGVTIHHWGNEGQSFDAVEGYLCSPNTRSSSAHYVLQEDRVSCIVSTDDVAWHSGNAVGNATTIGIECRPEMTEGDLNTLASLIRYLESVYGELVVYKHSDWFNTACPGKYESKIDAIVEKINNVTVAPVPPVVIPPEQPRHECCCHH